MLLSAGLAVLLAGLLLLVSSAAAGAQLPDAVFPTGGGGLFGDRLSPLSHSVYNSYPALPRGHHTGRAVGGYSDIGDSSSDNGDSYSDVVDSYYYNKIGSSHGDVGSGHSNPANNYDSSHSVYIRNNGHVADNSYSVETPSSALRAQSVHTVQPADPLHYQDNHLDHYGDYDDEARFQYRYEVSDPTTGDAKSKHETRDGDVVRGEYRVLEPNGLMRIVSYRADDAHGFVADVRWVPAERPHGAAVSHQQVAQQQSP